MFDRFFVQLLAQRIDFRKACGAFALVLVSLFPKELIASVQSFDQLDVFVINPLFQRQF